MAMSDTEKAHTLALGATVGGIVGSTVGIMFAFSHGKLVTAAAAVGGNMLGGYAGTQLAAMYVKDK